MPTVGLRLLGLTTGAVLASARGGITSAAGSAAGGLTGLYLQNQSIGRGDVWNYYYFWPDGHVCHVLPKGGLDPAPAYAAVARLTPAECGTFALGGGRLTLALGGGRPEALTYGNADATGGFALSGFPTIRVPAFPAGAHLSGAWHLLLIKGDDYRDITWTFRPDGTFAYDERPVRTSGAPARHAAGTYTLGGNTLTLASGGGSQRLSIHPFPGTGDRRLGLDGEVLQPR